MLEFGIIDSGNELIADVSTLFKSAVALVVLIIVVMIAVKTRFAVSTTLISAIIGGFVIWLVSFNGLSWLAEGIAGETNEGLAPTTSITQIW